MRAFFGWLPGGTAIMVLITCAIFTALTGASGVTILALGSLLYPALIKSGYSEKFSLGLVTSSGSLGLLLPPSLPLILYGIIAQQLDVGKTVTFRDLFIAGLFPAIIMILLLVAWSLWSNRRNLGRTIPFSVREAAGALKEAKWEIPLPFIVLGGIYGGFLAVSEAAVATVVYVIAIEAFLYKELNLRQLPSVIRDAMTMVGGIIIILGVSLASTNFIIDAEIPMLVFRFIQTYVTSKIAFLILLNILLLILGAILDIFSAIVIMVPLILPAAVSYGIHPVHLGIVFLANMQIGYFTPPVGMNLFIASYRFEKPIDALYMASIPFMIVLLLSVLMITYFPQISLFMVSG
jgi:tripartite ATP-independent transporter DctM subunit